MKKLIVRGLLLTVLMSVIMSCSKNNSDDAEALLSTVPSSAALVGVCDIESVLDKAGCDVDGVVIKPGKEFRKGVDAISDPEKKALIKSLLDGASGIRPTSVVFFIDGVTPCMTGLLEDTSKFKTFLSERDGYEFKQASDGVEIDKDVAIKGNQFWVSGARGEINAADVTGYTRLSESQSYLSTDFAKDMLGHAKDIYLVADIAGMANNIPGVDFKTRAMYSTVLNTLFSDASHAVLTVDVEKDMISTEVRVLDKKGKTAKFNFPVSKIDPATIDKLGGSADIVSAIAVSPKLVKKIEEVMKSFGGVVPTFYASMLSSLDGTSVFAMSQSQNSLRAIISTDGSASNDLSAQLSSMTTVDREGKYLLLGKGTDTGKGFTLQQSSGYLKGAFAGVVCSNLKGAEYVEILSAGLYPAGEGVELRVKAMLSNDLAKIIQSILGNISAK